MHVHDEHNNVEIEHYDHSGHQAHFHNFNTENVGVVNDHIEQIDNVHYDHGYDHIQELEDEIEHGAQMPPGGHQGHFEEIAVPVMTCEVQPAEKGTTARACPAHLMLSMHALLLATATGVANGDMQNVREDAVKNAESVTPVGAFLLNKHLW